MEFNGFEGAGDGQGENMLGLGLARRRAMSRFHCPGTIEVDKPMKLENASLQRKKR